MGLFSKKRAVPEIGDGPAESFEVRWRRDLTHERYIDESALWQRVHGHYEQSEVRWAASPVYVRFSDAAWDGYVYLTDERLIVEMHNPTEMQWGILSRPIPELQLVTWDAEAGGIRIGYLGSDGTPSAFVLLLHDGPLQRDFVKVLFHVINERLPRIPKA